MVSSWLLRLSYLFKLLPCYPTSVILLLPSPEAVLAASGASHNCPVSGQLKLPKFTLCKTVLFWANHLNALSPVDDSPHLKVGAFFLLPQQKKPREQAPNFWTATVGQMNCTAACLFHYFVMLHAESVNKNAGFSPVLWLRCRWSPLELKFNLYFWQKTQRNFLWLSSHSLAETPSVITVTCSAWGCWEMSQLLILC